MPQLKLTQAEIIKLPHPETNQTLYWDSDLKGFALRVTPGSKTFIVNARVKGKEVRVKIGAFGEVTPKSARETAKLLLWKMHNGINPNEEKRTEELEGITLGEAYHSYLQEKELRPNTLDSYNRAMNKVFGDWLSKPIAMIDQDMVDKRYISASKPSINEQNQIVVKNHASAKIAFSLLRSVFNWARKKYKTPSGKKLVTINPCDGLTEHDRWGKSTRRDNFIRTQDLPAFLQALKHQEHHSYKEKVVRDLCYVYILTGLRLSEATGLRWEDVDLKYKQLTITAERAKNHNKHQLPMGEWLTRLLSKYKEENEKKPTHEQSPYVFPSQSKNCIGQNIGKIGKWVQQISRECGVAFTTHDLRRTFITIANRHVQGITPYTLKRLMNHSNTADVTAGYIIHDIEDLRDPMQQIEDFVLSSADLT